MSIIVLDDLTHILEEDSCKGSLEPGDCSNEHQWHLVCHPEQFPISWRQLNEYLHWGVGDDPYCLSVRQLQLLALFRCTFRSSLVFGSTACFVTALGLCVRVILLPDSLDL